MTVDSYLILHCSDLLWSSEADLIPYGSIVKLSGVLNVNYFLLSSSSSYCQNPDVQSSLVKTIILHLSKKSYMVFGW